MPVLASTATTVAVFLPIGFVPAVVGEIFFNMSLAIIYSLLASLGGNNLSADAVFKIPRS